MAATTFTVTGQDYVRPYLQGSGSVRVRSFPEFASQTFLPGDVLIAGGTGANKQNQVKIASGTPTANVVGIAVHGATGVENTSWSGVGGGGWGSRTDSTALGAGQASSLGPGIAGSLGSGVGPSYVNVNNVATLQGNGHTKGLVQVYLALYESLFVIRAKAGQAISNDNIGLQYAVGRDATNLIWRLDNTDTSNKFAQVVGLFDNDGDVNGRYVIKIVAAANLLFGER